MNRASTFQSLLVKFSSVFTCPSLWTFMTLACGFVLCTGRRTISRVIQLGYVEEDRPHHSVFYRFFSRAVWLPNELGKRTLRLALDLGLIPANMRIILTVDDTLCRKSGAHIWGGGMHHDALLSNYGRGKSLVKFFSFGHNWVWKTRRTDGGADPKAKDETRESLGRSRTKSAEQKRQLARPHSS